MKELVETGDEYMLEIRDTYAHIEVDSFLKFLFNNYYVSIGYSCVLCFYFFFTTELKEVFN